MNEKDWVKTVVQRLENRLSEISKNLLRVADGKRLPYSSEILSYEDDNPTEQNYIKYETDVLIFEFINEKEWKPRIIIETKINNISTHDAITYSQKSHAHKNVHPYLRYGILIGNMEKKLLPGRLFRHGHHFDFMQSWETFEPTEEEWEMFFDVLKLEYEASLKLEEIIFNTRSKNRKKYSLLHRPLVLKGDKKE